MKFCLRILVLSLVITGARAGSDVADSRDPAGMERFPGSWIIQYSEDSSADHRLILGALKKIDGALQPERKERLRGSLTRVTYQVPEDYPLSAVLEHWQDQIFDIDRDLVFQCQGRECGSSNYWANRVFGIAELYGPDGQQHYEVTREVLGEVHRFHVLYLVRRGNRRIYVHVEDFRVPAAAAQKVSPDPRALISLLQRERRLVLRDIRFAEGNPDPVVPEAVLARIADALALQPVLPVAVVAHSYTGSSVEANLELSKQRARRLLDQLRKRVVAPNRLTAHGVGSLAPGGQGRDPRDRIELVLP